MSRIGKKIIAIPTGVTVTVQGAEAIVKGPKGELKSPVQNGIKVMVDTEGVHVTRTNDDRQTRSFHGLVRNLINNNIVGVTTGYKKTLKLIGTGYRATAKGSNISLAVGYSHPVDVVAPQGIQLQVEGQDTIHISGTDKQLVGQVAANIRKIRPPEPYKGKGIRYQDEVVRRKQGKTAA